MCLYCDRIANPDKHKLNSKPTEIKRSRIKPKAYKVAPYSKKGKERKSKERSAMVKYWNQEKSMHGGVCRCKECGKKIQEFSPTFVAHILSKGAHEYFRTDTRNFILLCFDCHFKFDHGLRKEMRIWAYCEQVIRDLKEEYAKIFKQD